MKKIVLITGTSTGLGISIAVKLAQQGHTIYATMRNTDKKTKLVEAAKTANVQINIKQLDVQNTQSIEDCVNNIIALEDRIDLLINNAGAGMVRTTEHATEEDIDWVMDVNFNGVVRCIKAVLPHMRQSKSGHIINITSVGGLVGQPFNEFYCAAKFAVEGYIESLATYITPSFNIKFSNIEPGGISTEFANNVFEHIAKTGGMIDDEYAPILQKYIASGTGRTNLYQTPEEVADVVVICAQNPTPPLRVRTSQWSEEFSRYKTELDPTGALQTQSVIDTFL